MVNKYLDLARELKEKLWNIKVTVISICALGTVSKGWGKKTKENGNQRKN